MVRYRIGGGEWSQTLLEKKIVIATPFYATTWFMILMIVAGITLIALIVRYISQRKLRKQLDELRVQEQIRNEKERISRDLHDNVGAQLTYVISTLDNLSFTLTKNPEPSKASEKLEQLGEFARGTMDQLRESIWAINAESISLTDLGGRWKQYLTQLAESRPEFTGTVSVYGTDHFLKPTVAIEIHRIIQEAITNSFKHSGSNSVEVSISGKGPIWFRVRDHGKGFDGAEKNGHYGIRNMKERAKLVGASIEFNKLENGTEIVLYYNDGFRLS
jgi:signal transduction histidine kinase